jgi:hypothetical protein
MNFVWWLLRYRDSHMHNVRCQNEFWCILGHPNVDASLSILALYFFKMSLGLTFFS